MILVLLAAVLPCPAPALERFEPEAGCYLAGYIDQDTASAGDPDAFEQLTGRRHAIYMDYEAYGDPFPTAWATALGERRCAAHLAWEPNDGLEAVADDDYLRQFARDAAATGVPIFLRFASEMNGWYVAWFGNPALYREKWRLVARVMHEEAPNVALVWCPFYHGPDFTPYYPGDEYVDWVGINLYSVYHHNNRPGSPAAAEDPRDGLRRVYRPYADRKPVMICEYGVTHREALHPEVDLTDYALDKLTTLYRSLAAEFPRVKCVQYFHWDTLSAGAAKNDYAVTNQPRLLDRYRELVHDSHFLTELEGTLWPAPPVAAPPPPPPIHPWLAALRRLFGRPVEPPPPDPTAEVVRLCDEARLAKRQQDYPRAWQLVHRAAALQPANAEVHWVTAWILCHQGQTGAARAEFRQVIRYAPTGERNLSAKRALAWLAVRAHLAELSKAENR